MRTPQTQSDGGTLPALPSRSRSKYPRDICNLSTPCLQKAEFQRLFSSTGTSRREKQPNTKLPGAGQGSEMTLAAPRRAGEARWPAAPRIPTMHPFVGPTGGRIAAERSFQWEYSKVQLLSARQGSLYCAMAQRDSVSSGAGGFVSGTRRFHSRTEPPERNHGVIEAG